MRMKNSGGPVRILPPLLYVVPFLLAWLSTRWWTLPLHLGIVGRLLGLVVLAAGLGLMTWAFLTFRQHGTTVLPWGRVSKLADDGPYAFTRNPIYLGDVLAYLGGALLIDSTLALLATPVIMAATYRLAIRHEESYLGETFGDDYLEYRRAVRRWL